MLLKYLLWWKQRFFPDEMIFNLHICSRKKRVIYEIMSPTIKHNIQEIIIHVLQGNASKKEIHSFSEWLSASRENKNLYFQLKHIYDYKKNGLYPEEREIQESWARLWRKMEKSLASQEEEEEEEKIPLLPKRRFHLGKWWVTTVATISILLITGILMIYLTQESSSKWVEISIPPKSQPQAIELPDGSSVQLNASSRLRFPEKFKKKSRDVFLDGEALFEIKKLNGKTFTVHSNKQRVEVLGTRFNIMDYMGDDYSITTLITGKIAWRDATEEKKAPTIMHPDQQLRFNKKTGDATLFNVDAEDVVGWTNGIYSFRNVTLEQVIERLEKQYNVVIITDETSLAEKYSGKFSSRQSIEEIIRIINFKKQFHCRTNGDTITLQRK